MADESGAPVEQSASPKEELFAAAGFPFAVRREDGRYYLGAEPDGLYFGDRRDAERYHRRSTAYKKLGALRELYPGRDFVVEDVR